LHCRGCAAAASSGEGNVAGYREFLNEQSPQRRDTTTATIATGDDDNDVNGDNATGNGVDDDGDGATGDDNDDDNNGNDALPLRCHCQRPALPSCAAAALQRQHSAPPLRCSCHAAAANALRCAAELRCSSAPLTCKDTTALQRCAAAANALHCRGCAAAASAGEGNVAGYREFLNEQSPQ
jgi:hypothetical protein